jgi:hypothetical protein
LHFAEVDLAFEHRPEGVEERGADEAEDRVAEVESDPGGDEQEAEQGEELTPPLSVCNMCARSN